MAKNNYQKAAFLKSVSKKYVIIGNPIIDDRLKIRNIKSFISSIGYFFLRKSAISSFLGKSDRNAYWILNKNGFKSLVESAGIKIIDTKIIYPKTEDFFSNRPRMIIFGLINNKFQFMISDNWQEVSKKIIIFF